MRRGIELAGDIVQLRSIRDWREDSEPDVEADVAVFYGLAEPMPNIFKAFRRNFAAVYVDLGYWGRRDGGRWAGYHKVVVDARHPNAYFQKPAHPLDRIQRFAILPKARHAPTANGHILLAGMGDKGAQAEGWAPEMWERWAIAKIREYSDRPIIYRPKPSWKTARPIEGTLYSGPHVRPIEKDLVNCHAVVTHHSNVAVDALVDGIPALCWAGVAAPLCSQNFQDLEAMPLPSIETRMQWMADLAYTQWSVAEIRDGKAWAHLREEGLI